MFFSFSERKTVEFGFKSQRSHCNKNKNKWEQIQKEISPRVLMLVMKVLNLRAGWNIEEMNKLD